MTPPGALPRPRAWLAGVVPGVPHMPAGHRDRQVKCRDLARFGPMHSPMSGRETPGTATGVPQRRPAWRQDARSGTGRRKDTARPAPAWPHCRAAEG